MSEVLAKAAGSAVMGYVVYEVCKTDRELCRYAVAGYLLMLYAAWRGVPYPWESVVLLALVFIIVFLWR